MGDSSKRSIYVLTIWQERPASPDQPVVWRVSVEDARTGEKHGFGSLKELVAFFQRRMAVQDQIDQRRIE